MPITIFWGGCWSMFGGGAPPRKSTPDFSVFFHEHFGLFYIKVDPTKGTVGFGSGLHGWAFTMKQFAEFYSAKFKIEPAKLMKRLWGDQFYNPKEKKWAKQHSDGYVRGFNQFILDPIYKVLHYFFVAGTYAV